MTITYGYSNGGHKINSHDRLIFYVDVMPSESISHENELTKLALVCAICGDVEKIKREFRQFKDTRGNHRKVKAARRWVEVFSSEDIDVRMLTSIATVRELKIMGAGMLHSLKKHADIRKEDEHFRFGDKRIHSRIALTCPWYAVSLSAFAGYAAKMCSELGYSQFTLALDQLPGDDMANNNCIGLEFLNYLLINSPVKNQWERAAVKDGILNCGFGYIGFPTDKNNPIPAKTDGQAILADWISQSVHAAVNHEWYVKQAANRTEQFRQEIAAICFKIKEIGGWVDIPVATKILEKAIAIRQAREI